MKTFRRFLKEEKTKFTADQAKALGDKLDVDWDKVDLEQLRKGLEVESEHDKPGKLDVVKSDLDLAKIALAHLDEFPDYYDRLAKAEKSK